MGCVVFAAVIFNIIKDAELSSSELMGIFIFVGALVFNVCIFWFYSHKVSLHETSSGELVGK